MESQITTQVKINPVMILLIAAAGFLVFAVLSGRKIPLVNSDRAALLVLIVLGMAMCTTGIGRVAESGSWTHPLAIAAYLVGGVILVVGVAALFGKVIPPLSGYRQSVLLVAILVPVKFILSNLHRIFL